MSNQRLQANRSEKPTWRGWTFRWPGEDFPTINQDMPFLGLKMILSLHVVSVHVFLLAWLTFTKASLSAGVFMISLKLNVPWVWTRVYLSLIPTITCRCLLQTVRLTHFMLVLNLQDHPDWQREAGSCVCGCWGFSAAAVKSYCSH